jgi:hypothetical protein
MKDGCLTIPSSVMLEYVTSRIIARARPYVVSFMLIGLEGGDRGKRDNERGRGTTTSLALREAHSRLAIRG